MTSPAYDEYEFFASCLAGFEQYLADELKRLRGRRIRPLHGGVAFFGTAAVAQASVPVVSSGSRVTLVVKRVTPAMQLAVRGHPPHPLA